MYIWHMTPFDPYIELVRVLGTPGALVVVGLYMQNRVVRFMEEMVTDNEKRMSTSLIDTANAANKVATQNERILAMVDTLCGDQIGNLDERLAIRLFAAQEHKQHLLLMAFFRDRIRKNHILEAEDAVAGRYLREGENLAGKSYGMLDGFKCHNGLRAESFWGRDHKGAISHYKHLVIELYNMHKLSALDPKESPLPSDDDLDSMFERLLSSKMQAFKTWLATGHDYQMQKNANTLPCMNLVRQMGSIELLLEEH